jgi:hypothetical protein
MIWHPVAETSKVSADHPAPPCLTTTRYFAWTLGNFRGFCTKAPAVDTGRLLLGFLDTSREPRFRARGAGRYL